jgi:hypothetical protein
MLLRCAIFDVCWTRLAHLPTLDLPLPIGRTTMKKMPTLQQQNLFDVLRTEAKMGLPGNIQTAPLKPLVQELLTDLIAARRFPVGKDEVKS